MALPEKLAHFKIPLEDIRSATNNFAAENLIKKGGFGRIYKGKLERSGKSIDIVARWLDKKDWRGGKAFWTDIYMLASLKHKNLVSIVGFCNENDEMIIVNKHEPKGSLDKYLSDQTFTWRQRLQVCLGIARGLSYIHYDKQRSSSVIHSNLKSSRILLDESWEAKIFGFELSKINPVARRSGLVLDHEISGTYAYADPAYIKTGGVTYKSDVYTLGVILFEVMCGKKAFISDDRDEWDIPHSWSKTLSNEGKLQEVDKDEARSTKTHSIEGIPDGVKCEGHSAQLARPLSNEGILNEVKRGEGRSTHLAKPVSSEGILDENIIGEGSSTQLPKPLSNEGKLQEVFENKISAHLGKQHSNEEVDGVMKPEIYQEKEGYSTHLTKQHSNEGKLVEVVEEGHSPLLTKPHCNGSKLAEADENEGGSSQFSEPHSDEGKVGVAAKFDSIFENEGHIPTVTRSASTVRELDYETGSLPPTIQDGVAKTSSIRTENPSVWELDFQAIANKSITSQKMLLGQPPSFSTFQGGGNSITWVDCGQPPSFNDIKQLIHENTSNSTYPITPPSFTALGTSAYSDNLSALYMTTIRNLKQLQVPKEGLLYQLAKSHYEAKTLDDIIHPGLLVQMESQSLKIFSEAAYCCLKEQRAQRPTIDRIIVALERALEHQLKRENSECSIVEAQGTSTSYLEGKDLEHLKIVLDALVSATENFAEKYYIASGGYGVVYNAELEHFDSSATKGKKDSRMPKIRSTVAIKSIILRDDTQGEEGFLLEIKTLSSCNHPNVISLLGFCYERPRMFLVYEHASNGSLDDYLGGEGKMTNLTWVQRIKICIDIARGLDYIHSTFLDKEKIIHRDVKSANILLNEKWEAKIADFGLSKVHPSDHTASTLNTLNVAGTKVYLDPDYEKTGKLKKESDIYSFGVVMFEILCGRLAYDKLYTNENEKGLAPIARQHFEKGTLKKMVDPKLRDESDENTFTLSKGPNQESLDTFSRIAYRCVAEKQAQRPRMEVIIKELEKALDFQETHKDSLRISFEDVSLATRNFDPDNLIGQGGFGKVYRGQIVHANAHTTIVVKRMDPKFGQGEKEFLMELEILSEYKHENIIGLVGYCDEKEERIIVYEYAFNSSLDKHLKVASLTWMKRLKIAIDVAAGLDFLHGGVVTQDMVIHRDIKSANILLTADWKAKIADFGLSIITPIETETEFVIDNAVGTVGYVDPLYIESQFLTKESDIYSLGIVLFEIMCGRLAFISEYEDGPRLISSLAKRHCEEGKLDEMVFKDIKDQIVPKSLATFQMIAYQCLHDKREDRPTSSQVVTQLKKALEFQEDYEIWEPKLPSDHKEIIQMSKTPEIYSNMNKKDLYDTLIKGILLQEAQVWFSLSANERRNEMISAKMFSYENQGLLKWKSIHKSRFPKVAKMMNTSNLNIQTKIKTRFLSPDVNYGVYLVFKFCNLRTFSNKPTYVNLRYKMRSVTLHTHFAIPRDDNWMMIELCRFLNHKQDTDFEVLLESFSAYCRGSGAICVEGIEFKAIENVENKQVQSDLKSNINMNDAELYLPTDYEHIIKRSNHAVHNKSKNELVSILFKGILIDEGEKFSSLSKVNGKKCHMLPAKAVLYDYANLKLYTMTQSDQSRFQVVIELLAHQVFRLKCKIERQLLASNTKYKCYLVYKLSEQCRGLHCPVKVRDQLLGKNKEIEILYLRSPSPLNSHDAIRVPEHREDGWMEVKLWEFDVIISLRKVMFLWI